MCRLFGYLSAQHESLKKPLLEEENSLYVLSKEHRDGWGIAYFHDGVPHVVKSTTRAGDDNDFLRLAKSVSAPLAIAHLRRATQGGISLLNCHPFQFGSWIFAHNGDLPGWHENRERFLSTIAPRFLPHIFGNTDSEIYFALFLSALLENGSPTEGEISLKSCALALRQAIARVMHVYEDIPLKKPFALNVLISNGRNLLAYRQGHGLFFRAEASPFARLSVCSEPFCKNAGFTEMQEGQMIGMDEKLQFFADI